MSEIRAPYVAGSFYPADPVELDQSLQALLDDAPPATGLPPKALIAPHAGFVYSGPVAATAYAQLKPYRNRYRRVVMLGPCHRLPVHGLALSACDTFRTPSGDVPVDKAAIAELDLPGVVTFEATHEREHCLEVQLPFLQAVLGRFSIVPIVVGDATHEAVANVLDRLWDGPETLIVVSSDLSHYLGYDEARRLDAATCHAIEEFDSRRINHSGACGATPIGGLLVAARRHGLAVRTVDLRNSGDTAGDRSSVVGYGAWIFVEPQ